MTIEALRTEIELERPTTVSLTGGNWRGTVRLTADACAAGPVTLPATPRPIRFPITPGLCIFEAFISWLWITVPNAP